MSDATREAQLIALTAKALRPIAAELGITGTSRMVKADIIAAILRTETERAELKACEHGTALNVYCDDCNSEKPAYAAQVDAVREMRARVLAQQTDELTPEQKVVVAEVTEQHVTAARATLPTAVRRTRHGVETVVIEDVRGGRVHFRNVENGRLSAPYTMRAASFADRYTPVSR
jgi:hypothetical protein